MNRAGHERYATSDNLSDTERNFLKRYSLKKITVPKEKLRDIVNLTVRREEEDLTEWLNPKYKIPKNETRKCERLEYRDLSKVIRTNVPWWMGTRGALNNLHGQRLVTLVEVTDEEQNFKNQRLEAGVEKKFMKMDSKVSVDVAEILSKGMEVCLTDTVKSVRKSKNAMPHVHASRQHCEPNVTEIQQDDLKSEHTNESVEIMEKLPECESKRESNKAGSQAEDINKMSSNSTDMSWIEQRLDRVQRLLMSLEDLRLQSGCEKCQGSGMEQGQQGNDFDNPTDDDCDGANGEHVNAGQERRAAFRGADATNYNSNRDITDSVLETKICKCDLEIIDREMTDLYCFLEGLSAKQTSAQEKLQYEIIMCRVLEIRQCFCHFTKKIFENAQSKAIQPTRPTQAEVQQVKNNNLKPTPELAEKRGSLGDFTSASNAACNCNGGGRKNDCSAAGPMFLDPPEAWCAQMKQDADENSCAKMVFVPCFYYNPNTGECKFSESDEREYENPPACNCKKDPNSDNPCCCWTCEPSNVVLKKKFPLNLSELLSQIAAIQGKEPPKNKGKEAKAQNSSKSREKGKDKGKGKQVESGSKNAAKGDKSDTCQDEAKTTATAKSKLPVPQQNSARPSRHCSVGKILLQDMAKEQQTDKCCCLQENQEQNSDDARFTCCSSRSRGSGLDEAHMNAASIDSLEDSKHNCDSSNSPTIIKIEAVCSSANIPDQEQHKKSTKTATRKRSSQELVKKSSQGIENKSKQESRLSQESMSRSKKEPSKRSSADSQKKSDKQQPSQLTVKLAIGNGKDTKRSSSSEATIKSMRPSVTFKSQSPKELCEKATQNSIGKSNEDISEKLKDVCKMLCDSSFKKLSDSCKNYYTNPSDPTKQMCDIPCKTICDLCKKSCDGAIDTIKNRITESSEQAVDPPKAENDDEEPTAQSKSTEKPSEECEELLKNYEIFKNYVKPIFDTERTKRIGNMDMSIHQSLSRLRSFMPKHASLPDKPCDCNLNFSQKSHDAEGSIADETSDSVVTMKSASCGDAPQNPLNQRCCCEGIPPIEVDLGNIVQNRIKNRKRGTVYLKFTMSPNNLFHIQMATINNEFLGCFYATEAAVMDARRTNGFEGCITLSVMEPSNSPSQINRLVDHAFMVVQQDRKTNP